MPIIFFCKKFDILCVNSHCCVIKFTTMNKSLDNDAFRNSVMYWQWRPNTHDTIANVNRQNLNYTWVDVKPDTDSGGYDLLRLVGSKCLKAGHYSWSIEISNYVEFSAIIGIAWYHIIHEFALQKMVLFTVGYNSENNSIRTNWNCQLGIGARITRHLRDEIQLRHSVDEPIVLSAEFDLILGQFEIYVDGAIVLTANITMEDINLGCNFGIVPIFTPVNKSTDDKLLHCRLKNAKLNVPSLQALCRNKVRYCMLNKHLQSNQMVFNRSNDICRKIRSHLPPPKLPESIVDYLCD